MVMRGAFERRLTAFCSHLRRRLSSIVPIIICLEIFILGVTTVNLTPPSSPRESEDKPQSSFDGSLYEIRDRLMAKAISGKGIRNDATDGHRLPLRTFAKLPSSQFLDFRPPILVEPEIDSKSEVVLLVPSHQGSFVKRQAIRETWKAAASKENATATVLFVVGQSDCNQFETDFGSKTGNMTVENPPITRNSMSAKMLAQSQRSCEEIDHDFLRLEQDQNHDLLEIPIIEAYTLLPEKMVQAYHWVLKSAQPSSGNDNNIRWIAKADDDMFVNLLKLENYLKKYNSEIPMVIGEIVQNSLVAKEGKWADTEYDREQYPDWPKGSAGHVLSRPVVQYIVEHSEELYRYQGEDTNIGIWMDMANQTVMYVHATELFGSGGKHLCQEIPFQYLIIGHELTPSDLENCQTHSSKHGVVEAAWSDIPRIYRSFLGY